MLTFGTGRDGTDKRTNIGTDRLFSENIILDSTIFMVQMKKADSSIKKSLVLLFRMECFFVSLSVAVAIKLILYVNQENQFHFLKL